MAPLELEPNIEIVRTCAILYRDELKRLSAELAQLKQEKLKLSDDPQAHLSEALRAKLSRLTHQYFGFGREEIGPKRKQRRVGHEQQKLKLHNDRVQVEAETEQRTQEKRDENAKDDLRKTVLSRIDHDFSPEHFKVENESREIAVPVSEDPKTAWQKIDRLTQDSVEITITERIYTKVVHSQLKYRLKDEYNSTGKEVIITAPGPVKLKPGSQYSVDFALAVVTDKYESHLPLERQRRRMEAAGLEVDVKTLYTLVRTVADHCEESVIPKIRRDILGDFCAAHLDETPWPIRSTRTRGQMWVLCNRVGSYYRFEPTRSGEVAEEILEGHLGSILTDGFAGYNRFKRLPGIRAAHCWAHARREFTDREEDYPVQVNEIVQMIDDLYAIEGRATTFEELRTLRATESKALIDQIRTWLWSAKSEFLGREGITQAINYSLKFWPGLTLFLQDLSVPLDNNSAERAERHAVMGRKNFGGSQSIDGADVAATLYTVIESCKKVGLEPREYFKYVITERWHGRDPRSPMEVSLERFGRNQRTIYPAKDQWRVFSGQT